MANLNKLLVHVPLALCEGFKEKYVKDTDRRDRSYDNKVVFLEDTQEIFTQGKLYGTKVKDFNELKDKVGTIPADAVSNNIVDYITELINKAGYIESVKKKDGEKYIEVETNNKNVTIYSTTKLDTAINNANNAIKELDLLGYKLDKNNKIITVSDAQTALRLGGAAYKSENYYATPAYVTEATDAVRGKDTDNKTAYTTYGTRAYAYYVAYEAAQGVVDILPGVKQGSGITVTPSTDSNGKTTYTISTSAEVFHYKGNKTSIEQLPASDNTTGDVWSVGPTIPTDDEGSTLYAWDGDEWINIGGAKGINGVDTTESHGVKLIKNQDGTVRADVTTGLVASGNGSVITGGTAYTAIFNAKKDCNSYMQGYIGRLNNSITYTNSAYVHVKVDTTGGNVSNVEVIETDALKTAVTKANNAMQSATILGYLVENGGEITVDQVKNKLGLGSAAYKDISYFDKADTAYNLISKLGGSASDTDTFVTVKVETSKGEVSKVTVTESDTLKNAVNGGIQTINGDLPYLKAVKQGTTVNLDFDQTEVFNYVSSNIWETYSA